MRIAGNSSESLSFKDGDAVLLTHVNNGKRVWANGTEAFSRAHFHADHIEFRELDDNGVDITETRPVTDAYYYAFFQALGDKAFKGAVLFAGAEDLRWHSTGIPNPDALNDFRQRHLVPEGANSFPLTVMDGNNDEGVFSTFTIMAALIDKKLPISSQPGYFYHDMDDHAVGMAAIDKNCMKVLRSFALFSTQLEPGNPVHSSDLAASIVSYLDYYSFDKIFVRDMAVGDIDPLLTNIMLNSVHFDVKHWNHMKKLLEANDFRFTYQGVMRSPETVEYYKSALEILDPER